MELIPSYWEDYLTKIDGSGNEVNLWLLMAENLEDVSSSSGWSIQKIDGCRQIVYAPNAKPYFTMAFEPTANTVVIYIRRALDAFVRTAVQYGMMIALHQTCIGLHGVTLQCDGQTVILSAPSGTGKTTLSHLLERYCGARAINGDFALLSLDKDEVVFEPTPFCGTSKVCLNERLRVDRIIFLSQSEENVWKKLDGRHSIKNMLSNCFVPSFDIELQQAVRMNVLRLLTKVKTNEFAFTPNSEAALFFLNKIFHD